MNTNDNFSSFVCPAEAFTGSDDWSAKTGTGFQASVVQFSMTEETHRYVVDQGFAYGQPSTTRYAFFIREGLRYLLDGKDVPYMGIVTDPNTLPPTGEFPDEHGNITAAFLLDNDTRYAIENEPLLSVYTDNEKYAYLVELGIRSCQESGYKPEYPANFRGRR